MKIKIVGLTLAVCSLLFACKNNEESKKEKGSETKTEVKAEPVKQAFDPATVGEEPIFDIATTEGTIRIKLYKETPLHRDNFVKLASESFYNNILFHRVIKGFMIQAGDPYTKDSSVPESKYGTGGPGYTVPAEILPEFNHKKGALAAARRPDTANPNRESSGSQFYIVENPTACASLDGDYSIFGETVSGLEVIDKIANVATGAKDRPVTPVKILSVTPIIEEAAEVATEKVAE